MYVPMKEILDRAYAGHYGVPAVLGENELCITAAIEAAERMHSPLIFINYVCYVPDPFFYVNMVRTFADEASVPVALCLDHSPTFQDTVAAIQAGFSSVMVDRSSLPLEKNIEEVRVLAEIAHAVGVTVEAELGHVGSASGGEESDFDFYTNPMDAKRFLEETGVDCLAVSIGTAHGAYRGVPKLQFERLAEINTACQKPLVLHGGSGSGDENIHLACSMGVTKVNFARDIVQATYDAVTGHDLSGDNMYDIFTYINESIRERVCHFMNITGSVNKAWTKTPVFGKRPFGAPRDPSMEYLLTR